MLPKIPMKGKTRASNGSLVDKEGKEEAAINLSIRKANYGDLLWVQLHGSSWWPAQVVDDSTISAIHKPRKRRKSEALVRLYGSYKYFFVDPVSTRLGFEDTLNRYRGSHYAVLEESLKQDIHHLKFGKSKEQEKKMKGKVGADVSQERRVKQKQNVISKTGTKKVPSSGRFSSRELDANSPAKKSKETSLGSVGTNENGSRKRKKVEAQKKSNLNSKRSAIEEKNRKERKREPHSKNSANRKKEQDMPCKQPRKNGTVSPRTSSGRASAGATRRTSLKRASLSDKFKEGINKKQKRNDNQKNHRHSSPNSKLRQNKVHKKPGNNAAKISRADKDAGKTKNGKTSKQEILSSTSEETDREPSARQLKIMRYLGLIGPAGSPYTRNGSISNYA